MSTRQLRARLDELGVSSKGCLEKADLVARLELAEQQGLGADWQGGERSFADADASAAPIDAGSFDAFQRLLAAPGTCFVNWHRQHNAACKAFAPEYRSLAATYAEVRFIRVDIDAVPELAGKYNVSGKSSAPWDRPLPVFHAFREGREVGGLRGPDPANPAALAAFVAKHTAA